MVYLGSSSPLKVPGPADSRLQALLLPTKLTAKITFPSIFSPFPLPPAQDLCFKVIINIKLGVFFPPGEKNSLQHEGRQSVGGFNKEVGADVSSIILCDCITRVRRTRSCLGVMLIIELKCI